MHQNLPILIVEDLEEDVILLKAALKQAGIQDPVQVVQNGEEAIDYLCGSDPYTDRSRFPFPSVVFTDLKMPRMDGFEVLSWLRHHPECSIIPVTVLTASRQDKDIRRAYELGANAYMVKPATLGELVSLVKLSYEFWARCEKPIVGPKC